MKSLKLSELAINIFSMADIKNFDNPSSVVNRIYNAIIAEPNAIVVGTKKFFETTRTGVFIQHKNFINDAILKFWMVSVKLFFGAMSELKMIFDHLARLALISATTLWNGLVPSRLRVSAIARSIRSSRKRLFSISFDKNDSCSEWGKVLNAVANTSVIAFAGVMISHHPLSFSLAVLEVESQGNIKVILTGAKYGKM